MLGMTPTSLRIGRQGRTRMLTLRGISSTVLTVRLDTKCCIVMFATTGHHFRYLVGPLSMSFGGAFLRRGAGRFAAARGRWMTPLGGG